MSLLISCEVHESSPPQIDPPDGSLAGRAGNRLAGVSPRRSLHSSGTAGTGTAVAIGSSIALSDIAGPLVAGVRRAV